FQASGLARRVHDSPTLKESFDKLVSKDESRATSKRTLDRRVATRWDSDKKCLSAHLHFHTEVEQLTGVSSHRLQAYRLNEAQWAIATDLVDALAIFEKATHLFSQAEVPLVIDVLPLLFNIRLSLIAMRDDSDPNLSAVIRVAAQAAIMMIHKYTVFTEECEIYYIAIVMCPDRKLDWFKARGYTAAQIKNIRTMVVKRWTEAY
ncbi:hypothetical protein DFP72DRAFT_793855, partial [Ephemerocybe angulata]